MFQLNGHFLSAMMTENVCSSETSRTAPGLNLCHCENSTSLTVDQVFFVCVRMHLSDCPRILMSCVMGRWLPLVCVQVSQIFQLHCMWFKGGGVQVCPAFILVQYNPCFLQINVEAFYMRGLIKKWKKCGTEPITAKVFLNKVKCIRVQWDTGEHGLFIIVPSWCIHNSVELLLKLLSMFFCLKQLEKPLNAFSWNFIQYYTPI
jgi:hypothetical protein